MLKDIFILIYIVSLVAGVIELLTTIKDKSNNKGRM